jgi:RNA methyltransferase, TrmH family
MTTTITSPHNPKLQTLRRLQRRRERDATGRFLVEGEDLIAAACAAGIAPLEGYRTPECEIEQASGVAFTEVAGQALAAVSALGSGARVAAVYEQRFAQTPSGPLCLYLHGLSDPGNVGTCLRSAHAFGAACVALGPGCADPHSPKAVRASMGAIFAVPMARVADVGALPGSKLALVAHRGRALAQVAAELADEIASETADGLPGPGRDAALSVLVGAEREGLPEELIAACDHVTHIPIASESLNAAMAATVALYEIDRHFTRVRAS